MHSAIVPSGSSDPCKFDTVCFMCSNNQISFHYSNYCLLINNVHHSDDEKRKIMTIVCQLLRVKWDIVQDLFSQTIHFPFCESCLKCVIDLIGLNQQLFLIESSVREKIRQIESSIAKCYKSKESIDQSECNERKTICAHLGYRQSFQQEIMEEYWNKELLRQKIDELNTTQNGVLDIDLSLIQLQLEKNVFKITKNETAAIVTENLDEALEIEKKIDFLHESLDISTMCETQFDDTNRQEFEYKFTLVCPRSEKGSDDEKLENDDGCESPMPILRFSDRIYDAVEGDSPSDDREMPQLSPCYVKDTLDSEDSKNFPDYKLPSKNPKLVETTNFKRNIFVPPTLKSVHLSPPQMSDINFTQHGDNSAKDNGFALVCKLCGKRTDGKRKKLKHRAKRDKSIQCPFCHGKFANLKLLRLHTQNIHFPLGSVNTKKDTGKDSDKFGLHGEKEDIKINTGSFIYDHEEMVESSSDGEEPNMAGISTGVSSSEEENKTEQVAKPIIRRKSSSQRKRAAIGTKLKETAPNTSESALDLPDVKEYIAKDKTTWTTLEPPKTKTREYSILRQDGKLLGRAADSNLTPAELFKLMVSPDIVDLIVKYTNMFAEGVHSQSKSHNENDDERRNSFQRPIKPITQEEIYAFIGINLFFGLEKKSKSSANEAWNKNGKYSIPCIAATMSRDRFKKINQCIRFDDQIARRRAIAQGIIPEKLSYVSEIFNPFVENIGSYLQPYDGLVVDEMLIKFRGTSKFRVYMKSKPGKYGIKIWACCDTKTGYVLRLNIYQGKQGDKVETDLGRKVVLGLVKNYFGTGRLVTTDNFFTSKSLAYKLMEQNMSLLGTLNKNRMDVIPEFTDGRGRAVESSIFAFQNDLTMVSYIPRKNKCVVLLSTHHHSVDINPEIKNKPQMILDYNKTKGGVDTADQMMGNYSCQRSTIRWPMKIFFAMCDIGALNAYHIWKLHQSSNNKNGRVNFLRMLTESLMEPLVKARALIGRLMPLSTNTKRGMEMMGYPIVYPDSVKFEAGGRGNCMFCKGHKKSTRSGCSECKKWTCKEHSMIYRLCVDCNELRDKVPKSTKKQVKQVKQVKHEEKVEKSSKPAFDPEPDIYATPVKRKTKERKQLLQSAHSVHRMGLRAPTKVIQKMRTCAVKQNEEKTKTKLLPKNLFNEVETQKIQLNNSFQIASKTIKPTQDPVPFQSSNFSLPQNNQNQFFTNGSNLQPICLMQPVLAQSKPRIVPSITVAPFQNKFTTQPPNMFSPTPVGQPTTILPTMPQQFVQSGQSMAYVNSMNTPYEVSNQMSQNYISTHAKNPYKTFTFNPNMVLKPVSRSSLPVRRTLTMETSVPTKKTNAQSKPQVNQLVVAEIIDISD